jgi:cytosine/uracil/thiamine/allantoin permease
MSVPKDAPARNATTLERTLAFAVVSSIGLSVIAILAVLIGAASGAAANHGFEQNFWPTVRILPAIGLPLGFVCLLTLLVLGAVRRSRAAKDASN